jgi:hypothetical protein
MLSVLDANYRIAWPAEFITLFRLSSFFNFGLMQMFRINCAVELSAYHHLLLQTLAPPVVMLAIFLFVQLKLAMQTVYSQYSGYRRKLQSQGIRACLLVMLLVYPSVCRTILFMLKTRRIGETYYMESEMSTAAEGDAHQAWMLYTYMMILVYPVGVPVMLFSVLFVHRKHLDDPAVQLKIGFLVEGIAPENWYHEITELIRKLILSSVIIFVRPGTVTQIAVAIFVSAGFAVYHFLAQPFVEKSADHLQTACLLQLTMLLFAGLLLSANTGLSQGTLCDAAVNSEGCWEYQLFTWLLLVLSYGVVIMGLVAVGPCFGWGIGAAIWE